MLSNNSTNLKINKKMRSKAYNIVLAAWVAFLTIGVANAQSVPPVPAVQPVPKVAAVPATPAVPSVAPDAGVYVYSPGQAYTYAGSNVYVVNTRDSAYRTKMRKLQDQMHALTKEMTELSSEERKKNGELFQQKMALVTKKNRLHFDSLLTTRTFAYHYDSDGPSKSLEKQIQDGDVKEKSKTFSKSYALDANDAIEISNYYGKINVNTWAKKEVKVDVDIKAYANEDADAQKLLDQTTINSGKDGNVVSFKTDINQGGNSWWGTITQNGKVTKTRKVVINYTIYMPAKSALSVNNKYGSVNLPDLDGKLNIKNSYGGLVAKTLTNTDNIIVINYGDANIASMSGSQVNVAYGSLALDEADNLNATVKYSPIKIGKLNSSGIIDVKYGGGLVINDLGKGFKTLAINSSYTPVKLGSSSTTNADFDVTTHYGDFSYDNTTNVTSQTPDKDRGYTSTKNYKGHVGKGSSDKVITIKSSYGSVKFN
jgi:hypothetical protein